MNPKNVILVPHNFDELVRLYRPDYPDADKDMQRLAICKAIKEETAEIADEIVTLSDRLFAGSIRTLLRKCATL